ncbi:MAG: hypothetical protein QXD51_03120 [Candidatus Anstonellales archaeon]
MVSAEMAKYRKLVRRYIHGDIKIEELLEECKNGFSIIAAARELIEYIVFCEDREKVNRAKEGLKKLAEKKVEYIVPEITRRVIFSINDCEKKKLEWNKEELDFLFSILDMADIIFVGKYVERDASAYSERYNAQTTRYEEYEEKLKLPGAKILFKYILDRAAKEEEVRLLEERVDKKEYFHKNGKRNAAEIIPKNVLRGYLRMLAERAAKNNDLRIIERYAHFYEFVFYVICTSSIDVCKKRMEAERFFTIVHTLFENGSKNRVLNVLFKGLEKGGEEKKCLLAEGINHIIKNDPKVLISYYEMGKSEKMKQRIEDFALRFGTEDIKRAIFDKNMPAYDTQTFKNPEPLKRKT